MAQGHYHILVSEWLKTKKKREEKEQRGEKIKEGEKIDCATSASMDDSSFRDFKE